MNGRRLFGLLDENCVDDGWYRDSRIFLSRSDDVDESNLNNPLDDDGPFADDVVDREGNMIYLLD